jgi:hypothetical protein
VDLLVEGSRIRIEADQANLAEHGHVMRLHGHDRLILVLGCSADPHGERADRRLRRRRRRGATAGSGSN